MAGRLYVVGDIHGCAGELDALVAALPLARGDTLAFVGDYLDRGPAVRAVIDLLLALRAREGLTTVFLRGNHEDMCLAWLGRGGQWGESWMMNGAPATLASYGVPLDLDGPLAAAEYLPPAHLEFLEGLLPWSIADRFLLVHAGIRPGRPLGQQAREDILWIREEFILRPHDLPHTVVFGHTPRREILVDLPYKIGIDTGCVYGGRLTAIELTEGVVYQVARGERQVRRRALGPIGGALSRP
jgi:serine/threonine protein phosphatase 1